MSQQKTGLHANTLRAEGGAEAILDYYRRSRARIFKTLEFDHELFRRLRELVPGIVIIGRVYESDQSFDHEKQAAYIRRCVALAREYPEVDYWEGYNEINGDVATFAKFAAMEIDRVRALADVGAHAAVGCFSVGQPALPYGDTGNDGGARWRAFLPAIHGAMRHEGILALHEYGAPWMTYLVEGDVWSSQAFGWLCLRYRQAVRYLRELGVRMYHPTTTPAGLRIVITESGIDGGITGRPGPPGGGWADFTGWPDPILGPYPAQRFWYQWQVSQDAYVLGVTSFGECSIDPTWHKFSLLYTAENRDAIIALEGGLPDTEVTPMLEGIDVSRWQGAIDWARVAAAGIRFAFIKASEGSGWRDPRYAANAAGAAAAGVLFGPYHYAKNGIDPDAQAAHFAAVAGDSYTLPPVLDFEDSGPVDAGAMRRLCEAVTARMGRPIIYTAAWWWNRARLGGAQPWAAAYPLWAADYAGAIAVPTDWPTWTIHQYTSTGRVDGVAGNCDRNHFPGTVAELAALRAPTGDPVAAAARAWFDEHQAIFPAPGNALPDAVTGAGLDMYTGEGRLVVAGREYAVMGAGKPGDTADEHVFVVPVGDWGNVRRIRRR